MRKLWILALSLVLVACASQKEKEGGKKILEAKAIEVVDITSKQIRLMEKYRTMESYDWSTLMLDSIYKPYFNIWKDYIGTERRFLDWMHHDVKDILRQTDLKSNARKVKKVKKALFSKSEKMEQFLNYKVGGKWVLLFGSGTVDLGGYDDGTMLIDLSHESNRDLKHILKMLPHEINHQVYSKTLGIVEDKVLHRIIGEGLSCYVSYRFNRQKNEIYEELGYTEKEYAFCRKYEKGVLHILEQNFRSRDVEIAKNLGDRKHHYLNIYPGALGYYIGFRIVEEYVRKHGEESWRDLYTMQPIEVLRGSGLLKNI